MKALSEAIFHFKLLFFPAKSTIQLFLLTSIGYRRSLLYYYYLAKLLENKEENSFLTTISSKEKVFHGHVPHLQQKASRDGKKNKGKQSISLAVQDLFCHQKQVF